MRTALLLVDWPTHLLPNSGLDQEWSALLERVRAVRVSNPEIAEIHAGAWQIPLGEGVRPLVAMCQAVDGDRGSSWGCRLLFFPDLPAWITSKSERG